MVLPQDGRQNFKPQRSAGNTKALAFCAFCAFLRQLKFEVRVKLFGAALLLAGACSALAAVRYVDVNSTNVTTPYTNWLTAATNIQDAVDAAAAGDEIVVTNGI